jgi:hypothetical protein
MTSVPLEDLFARQQAARWRVAATTVNQRKAKLQALLDSLMAHREEPKPLWPRISASRPKKSISRSCIPSSPRSRRPCATCRVG